MVPSQIAIVIKYLEQLKFVYYHRSGNKNIDQGVCQLELSVNVKFVACGTVVTILAILKSPCAMECYLIQKPEPVSFHILIY